MMLKYLSLSAVTFKQSTVGTVLYALSLMSCDNDSVQKTSADSSVSSRYNTFYSTKTNIEVDNIPIDFGSVVRVGKGVNLEDPNYPIPINNDIVLVGEVPTVEPFLNSFSASLSEPIPYDSARKQESIRFLENEDENTLAVMLQVKFGVRSGFTNYGASLNYVRNTRREGKLIVFDATSRISRGLDIHSVGINSSKKNHLKQIEKLKSDATRYDVFTNNYGTHYINAVTYGYSISIMGSVQTSSETEKASFSAYFKNFCVRVNVDASARQFLTSRNVTINATIDAGGQSTSVYLTGFDQIQQYFDGLNNGTVKIYPTPVAFKATSLRPLLDPALYYKTYSMLLPILGEKASAPFGVPMGTIVAYYPINTSRIIISENGELELNSSLPDGWALCDGKNRTPDLRGRFIYGMESYKDIGTTGGSIEHSHTGSTGEQSSLGGIEQGGDAEAAMRHNHSFSTSASSNLPPYYKLVYIIKI